MEALRASAEDVAWIPVEESSAPGRVRRCATAVAERLSFSEHRTGEVAIAATELATNLHRHAVAGTVVVRIRREANDSGVELVVIDAGPGVDDLLLLARDGHSSGGTLGIGLGAAMRLSSSFDGHSVRGRGTVMVATFWRGASPPPSRIAALTRPIATEAVCGDAWAQRCDGTATSLLLADGLGHGELAAAAGREAVRAFLDEPEIASPALAIRRIDRALHSTRGAAVAIVRFEANGEALTFAGVGNVAVWIDDGVQRRGLLSTPGIVGHNLRKVQDLSAPLPAAATVVMHSDGLTSKWDLAGYPGLRARDPQLIAATLMRDAGVRHDDASVVVACAS